eukprot:gene19001-22745_t
MIAEERLKYIIEQYELEYYKIEGDNCSALYTPEFQAMLKQLDLDKFLQERKNIDLKDPEKFNAYYEGSKEFDLIIPSTLCITEAIVVNLKLGIPFVPLHPMPTLPTGSFPHLCVSGSNFYFKSLNRFTYSLVHKYYIKTELERLAPWVESLGMAPLSKSEINYNDPNQTHIIAIHPRMIKGERVPQDYSPKWKITGSLFPVIPDESSIPEHVGKFLESCQEPPVVFGLGTSCGNSTIESNLFPNVKDRLIGKTIIKSFFATTKAGFSINFVLGNQSVDPLITDIKPKSFPTTGGVVSLVGLNFANQLDNSLFMSMAGLDISKDCTIDSNELITCKVSAGIGANVGFFGAPVVNGITIKGNSVTISGKNFIPVGVLFKRTSSFVNLSPDGSLVLCDSSTFVDQTTILCETNRLSMDNPKLSVTIEGQQSTMDLIPTPKPTEPTPKPT